MGRLYQSLPALALGMVAALALASCGGSNAQLLSGRTARDITANLDTVKQLADEGDCVAAESAAQQVSEQVEALSGVDAKLKRALQEGAVRLNEVVASCEEPESEEAVQTTVPTEATSPEGKTTKKRERAEEEHKENKENREEETGTGETTSPSPPTEGEGTGNGNEGVPGAGEEGGEEAASGGVGPGAPVEGGQ